MRRIPVLPGSQTLHSHLLHSSDCWKIRPFREILVIPTGRIWAREGEREERASKALFKPISRINLLISNMMYEVHSCSPRFSKATILPAPLNWPPPASPCIRSFFFQFTTVLFFCLIQSYWVSKVRYCLPLVCSCTHNKTIHVTAN